MENFRYSQEYDEIVFSLLTFMMNFTINLMNELYYEYERKKNIIHCALGVFKNYKIFKKKKKSNLLIMGSWKSKK